MFHGPWACVIICPFCSFHVSFFLNQDPTGAGTAPPVDSRSDLFGPWRSKARFWLILGRPRSDQKINDFSTPSKIDPRARKIRSGLEAPEACLNWLALRST